jgi:hypothetical protein
MEGERRRRKILLRQAGEAVYKVFSNCKREADTGVPVGDIVKAQERTAEACDTSIGSVQRINGEDNVAICLSLRATRLPSFVSVTLV